MIHAQRLLPIFHTFSLTHGGGVVEFSRFVAALAPASALVDPEMLRSSFNRLDVRTPNTWLTGNPPF